MDLVLRHAHTVGITERQIKEVIYQVMYYAGQPKGLFAMKRLKAVMAESKGARNGARKGRAAR
jgi:alkylhydroperoxidase/carboxymuconolactone decarboxylase family protein YurZ